MLMSLLLSKASCKLIHLQRRTTVLSFDRKKPPGESVTSSDNTDSDADVESTVLQALTDAPKGEEGKYELVLRRGITHSHQTSSRMTGRRGEPLEIEKDSFNPNNPNKAVVFKENAKINAKAKNSRRDEKHLKL